MALILNGCPRCNGTLVPDWPDPDLMCLSCGYVKYHLNGPQELKYSRNQPTKMERKQA